MPIRPEMRDRYPADWELRSRFVRFTRARGCCEWCGVPHGWQVWRHPENHRSWYARIEIDRLDVYRVRQTCWELSIGSAPSNFTGPTKIVLTCAHVHDRRPEAASLLNLAALCQLCHNRHDAKHRAAERRARAISDQLQLRI